MVVISWKKQTLYVTRYCSSNRDVTHKVTYTEMQKFSQVWAAPIVQKGSPAAPSVYTYVSDRISGHKSMSSIFVRRRRDPQCGGGERLRRDPDLWRKKRGAQFSPPSFNRIWGSPWNMARERSGDGMQYSNFGFWCALSNGFFPPCIVNLCLFSLLTLC